MPVFANSALAQALAPFYGSCMIEVSTDDGANYYNVGLCRDVNFSEVITTAKIQADNGPDLKKYISEHSVNITFNDLEFYIPTFDKIRGGIDTMGVTTGGAVTTDSDVHTTGSWVRSRPYYFEHQGDSATLPVIIWVKVVSTAAVEDTLSSTKDYSSFMDANNKCGIIILSTDIADGATELTTGSLRIKYSYLSIPARTWKSGGLSEISDRRFRLTNKQIVSGTAKYRYLTVYSGTLDAGLSFAFKSSNESDPVLLAPFTIRADLDVSRSIGDQLFLIEDEVATA